MPVVRGERKVALHANNAQTVLFALSFAQEQELDAVLYGATQGWMIADRIAKAGVPVVVGPLLGSSRSRFEPYDALYANAAVLQRAGVEIAIQSNDNQNPRNLAHHAAMASAFGLPAAEAVRAITLGPARILGVDDELGSLEPGKIADVVVTDGDLLEITSRVEYLFIDGVQVDLDNRQTRLYERYKDRLERLQAEGGQ